MMRTCAGAPARSPRQRCLRLAAVGLLMLTTLFVGSPIAAAQPSIAVETGFSGQHRPGTDLLVQIEIEADRLIDGEIVISSRFDDRAATVVPVELAGGARKRFIAVVPTVSQGANLAVQLVENGEVLASQGVNPRAAQEDELVGVLPSLADGAPATAQLAVPLGNAQIAPLTEAILAAGPGAIDALGIIVATVEDVSALSPSAQDALVAWINDGGDLVLNDSPGPVPGLSLNADETRSAIGRGSVRAVAGAFSQGSWDGVLFPSSMPQDVFGPGSMTAELTGETNWFGGPMANALAKDSGFGLPPLSVVLPLMLVYVLIVGPLGFMLLRRLGRPQLLWLAVPTIAFLFTAGVWIAGSTLRSNTTDAHGSIIEVVEGSANAQSSILRSSRGGGTTSVELPPSWRPTVDGQSRFGPDSGATSSIRFEGGQTLSSDLDAGGFVLMGATGPVPDYAGALHATATSSQNGKVTGTVTNQLDVPLEEVAVFVSFNGINIGTVPAGETVTFVLDEPESNPRFNEPVDMKVWGNSFQPEFGPFGQSQPQLADAALSMEVWSNYMSANIGQVREPGTVTVVGWTRDLPSPLDPSIDQGRTGVVARADIEVIDSLMTDIASRRVLLRGMEQAGFNENFGPGFTVTTAWRFDVPADVDTGLLGLAIPSSVTEIEVWDGSEWLVLTGAEAGTYELPAAAFVHGSLYVKPTVDFEGNQMLGRDFSLRVLESAEDVHRDLVAPETLLEAADE